MPRAANLETPCHTRPADGLGMRWTLYVASLRRPSSGSMRRAGSMEWLASFLFESKERNTCDYKSERNNHDSWLYIYSSSKTFRISRVLSHLVTLSHWYQYRRTCSPNCREHDLQSNSARAMVWPQNSTDKDSTAETWTCWHLLYILQILWTSEVHVKGCPFFAYETVSCRWLFVDYVDHHWLHSQDLGRIHNCTIVAVFSEFIHLVVAALFFSQNEDLAFQLWNSSLAASRSCPLSEIVTPSPVSTCKRWHYVLLYGFL